MPIASVGCRHTGNYTRYCFPLVFGRKENLVLAYKTLGVVFGGLVTSPLYVYPSMPLKSPTEDDYLGIYSIMFWTISLIGVVKYASIAFKADDHGEGGTFALYSLLCRNINIGILSSKRVESNSSLLSTNQYGESEKQCRLGKFFERSLVSRKVLLFIAILGMCMLIGDGILTPAISVLSAMDGLRAPFPSVSKTLVEALSAIVLIALFMLQKFGTSRAAKLAGVVHVRGKTRFYIGKNCSWFDRTMLAFYEVLHSNCRPALPALGIPLPQRIEVGMLYET
ncbi:putative potassium transporter 17 [Forsythia ovata]|uniref:Potassium transporter 17 n=1 Tax=Forsythia ovata TaxID=205694 RepID=A0ABD1W805_9LAMI